MGERLLQHATLKTPDLDKTDRWNGKSCRQANQQDTTFEDTGGERTEEDIMSKRKKKKEFIIREWRNDLNKIVLGGANNYHPDTMCISMEAFNDVETFIDILLKSQAARFATEIDNILLMEGESSQRFWLLDLRSRLLGIK